MSGNSSFDVLTKVAASAAPIVKTETTKSAPPPNVPTQLPASDPPEPRVVSAAIKNDWHLFLTVEERNSIRSNIRAAYKKKTTTYEELLETCAAIEEELVFLSAPSRLDYFKAGIQYEKRVTEKRKQLCGDNTSMMVPSVVEVVPQPSLKRSRSAPSGGAN